MRFYSISEHCAQLHTKGQRKHLETNLYFLTTTNEGVIETPFKKKILLKVSLVISNFFFTKKKQAIFSWKKSGEGGCNQ